MRNESVKILFSDLYRHQRDIKTELKDAGKLTDDVLSQGEWEGLAKVAQELWDEVTLIEKHAECMRRLLEDFIAAGDYEGQTVNMTPMESLAAQE